MEKIISLVLFIGLSFADHAVVNITMEGNCPPMFMYLHRGLQYTRFVPRISFNEAKVTFDPENPTIPGCMTVKIKNVQIRDDARFRNPLVDISAEYDLRIGGTPGLDSTKLACGKSSQQQSCDCGKGNDCMVCGFCKNMQRVGNQLSFSPLKKLGALDEDTSNSNCDCQDPFAPGMYDLETEICTPSKDEIQQTLPHEMLELMGNNQKVSMWTAIYLYDGYKGTDYSSTVSPGIPNLAIRSMTRPDGSVVDLERNSRTIGCFMLGYNVNVEV